jgi:hypothetical protein
MLLFAGCGARDGLHVGSGQGGSSGASSTTATSSSSSSSASSGSPVTHHGFMRNDCAPNDAPGLGFPIYDAPSCSAAGTTGIYVFVTGVDPAGLMPGVTLNVSGDLNAPVQAQHVVPGGVPAPATSGTITFTSFVKDESAAGTYNISFTDGTTEQSSFTVVWCPGVATCG